MPERKLLNFGEKVKAFAQSECHLLSPVRTQHFDEKGVKLKKKYDKSEEEKQNKSNFCENIKHLLKVSAIKKVKVIRK